MWLKAKENNKTYLVEQGTIAYSKSKGLFYVSDHSLCDLINFKEWSINDFFNLKWAEIPEKTMTRTEAEKQLGIKIVGGVREMTREEAIEYWEQFNTTLKNEMEAKEDGRT